MNNTTRKSTGIRWWVKFRPDADQSSAKNHPILRSIVVVKPYVPWWAWPMELIYRAIYGKDLLRNP